MPASSWRPTAPSCSARRTRDREVHHDTEDRGLEGKARHRSAEVETTSVAGLRQVVADRTSGLRAGDVVTFTYTITNSGTSSMTSANLASGLPGGEVRITPLGHWLYPGKQRVCTAPYTVTGHDAAADGFTDTAKSEAHYADGPGLLQVASVHLTTPEDPGLAVSVDPQPGRGLSIGQTMTETITLDNTGAVSLHDFTMTHSAPTSAPTTARGVDPSVDPAPTTDVRRGTTIQHRMTVTNTENVTGPSATPDSRIHRFAWQRTGESPRV